MFGLDPREIFEDLLPTMYKWARVVIAERLLIELLSRGPQTPANLDPESIDTYCKTALSIADRLLELGEISCPEPESEK